MKPSAMLKLPASRAQQLKALARARNTTMTELIGEMINRAIADGELTDETPGLKFSSTHGTSLTIELDREQFRLNFDQAQQFFHSLATITRSGGEWRVVELRRSLEIHRAGSGLVLEIKQDDHAIARMSLTPSIALDVRRQISAIYPEYFGFLRTEFQM